MVMISRGAVEFQSTLPRRERRYTIYLYQISTLYFNPRSREGSDSIKTVTAFMCKHFNPRSREGSDNIQFFCGIICNISIHAPAKGATQGGSWDLGADVFQSTLPRRERLSGHIVKSVCRRISIHAPAKGATPQPQFDAHADPYFNPRSREGSDGASVTVKSGMEKISIHALAKGATKSKTGK